MTPTPCISSTNQTTKRRKRILLGITGSVAAVKGPELALLLSQELDAHIVILLTHGGANFFDKAKDYNPKVWKEYEDLQSRKRLSMDGSANNGNESSSPSLPGDDDEGNEDGAIITLLTAQDEWKGWQRMNDPVLHIQLREWADAVVVAPLSAHTLAKIATGLCDDTLTCVLRAWDFRQKKLPQKGKPIVLAPAMNTAMWEHPLTQSQLKTIQNFGTDENNEINCPIAIVAPQVKTLACGEVGNGALASTIDIVTITRDLMNE